MVVPVFSDSKDEQKEAEEFKKQQVLLQDRLQHGRDCQEYPLPKFYNFPSVEARERILYANFLKVNLEVKDMISEIQEFYKK